MQEDCQKDSSTYNQKDTDRIAAAAGQGDTLAGLWIPAETHWQGIDSKKLCTVVCFHLILTFYNRN